jgi:cytochrome P450
MTPPSDPTPWGGWDAAVRDDPYAAFAAARDRCPVAPVRLADGHDAWVVLDHEGARQALNDPRISKDMLAALAEDPDVVAEGLPGPAYARHMLALDPPDHTRLRRLVARAFVPSRVAALEPAVQALADRLLDDLAAAGPDAVVDLVAGYARPLPFQVISEMLGVPVAVRSELHDGFRTLLAPWTGDPPPAAVAASDLVVGHLERLVDDKRRHPGDDLVSVLVAGTTDGDLPDDELIANLLTIYNGGFVSTTHLIGNGLVLLLERPHEIEPVLTDPARAASFVQEVLRYEPPTHFGVRWASEPTEIAGVPIPVDSRVLLLFAAANRDPSHFSDPDVFDARRDEGPSMTFGLGMHYCIGAALSRMEGQLALPMLLRRFPKLRLASDPGERTTLILRGYKSLPVVLA